MKSHDKNILSKFGVTKRAKMKKAFPLSLIITIISLSAFSQRSTEIQPATFGIHFIYHDFTSAANIRSTSLSTTFREKKFGRIKDMSPGLALNYLLGLSPQFDFTTTLAGAFLDYPFQDSILSDKKNLLLEADLSIRGKMFDNRHPISPYIQIGAGISKYKSYWGAFVPLGLGLQVNAINELYVIVNAQYRLPVTEQTVSHHFFYSFGIAGIIGKKKKRITPVSAPPPVPILPADRDNDGIVDTADACPDQPGQAQFNGCPDRDEDGLPDKDDNCPTVKGLARYKGCPIPDTDKDGINDETDRCIDVPGIAKYEGCPPPDRDKDGVPDELDRCPDLAGLNSKDGCPEIKESLRQKVNLAAQNIFFASDSYRILPKSHNALNDIVNLMQGDTALRLNIEGHTDNTGTTLKNQTLSTQRAKAVYEYLIQRGIEDSRLRFVGFGQERPVTENNTASGRSRNRRVELVIGY